MIFIGDIAIPDGVEIMIENWPKSLLDSSFVANLEGCIVKDPSLKQGVYNSFNTIKYLKKLNVMAVSLANNHIQDYSEYILDTMEELNSEGIQYVGATLKEETQEDFKRVIIDGKEYYFISGAAYITGVTKKRNKKDEYVYVNELDENRIKESINSIKSINKKAIIICLFHWGCELELYPYPADREMAKRFIDMGVYAVIGCHSHCIQGVEFYKGSPIVYGMGNFLFYQGHYWDGKLVFPSISEQEMAFEIDEDKYKCHWFHYDREDNVLKYERTTSANDPMVQKFTPYAGMSYDEYCNWFKKHRRKRKMIPIWYDKENIVKVQLKKLILDFRELIINVLKKLKVKGGPH